MPDYTRFEPGTAFDKSWLFSNAGTTAWGEDVVLRHIDGELLCEETEYAVPSASPGQKIEVTVPMQAPGEPGTYKSTWQLCAQDICFGTAAYAVIVSAWPATAAPPPVAGPVPVVPPVDPTAGGVVITSVRKSAQPKTVTIANQGESAVDLTGWWLLRHHRDTALQLPAGTVIQPGSSISIFSGPEADTAGPLLWTTAYMWNNDKYDPADLYNASGELVSTTAPVIRQRACSLA